MGQYKSYVPVISILIYLSRINTQNLISLLFIFLFVSCSSSKRFTSETNNYEVSNELSIRVLLQESENKSSLILDEDLEVFIEGKKIALIKRKNKFEVVGNGDNIILKLNKKEFNAKQILLTPASYDYFSYKNRKYRGSLKIISINSEIKILNQISLEDYVKGVMTKEMPVGNGNENFEALKAFAICVRTYAINKLNERNFEFDILPDTRDQVYGGVEGEHPLSNKAVDETREQILTWNDQPATMFYHSTCGGYTENTINVFSKKEISYLSGIKDGDPPNCQISPRFDWSESYSYTEFLNRLKLAGYINSNAYILKNAIIVSKFSSGRVNELTITLKRESSTEETISLFGNSIRSVVKNSEGTGILRSTMFDIHLDGSSVRLDGHGAGHGVGLCQWGAIGLSRSGKNFKEIIQHYFPGVNISKYD